ncbi:MAG: ATP-grasp domain-containing protein [Pseudobutyrivibrio sp.]|nr:ATP-grasp domain-containing protein [Pseudobutyrivibrio sp.]
MSKKKILVYPCGTEIGLEVYRSLRYSTHYELWGGSCSYDHGRFVFENHIDDLPFITDRSNADEIREFDEKIKDYGFDFIYPVMDGVITVFSKYRDCLTPVVIASDYSATEITRSKRKTYEKLGDVVATPKVYNFKAEITEYPVFKKPDVGQGSSGAMKINDETELLDSFFTDGKSMVLEYMPGEEYTIDCLTNRRGELVYARARGRRRIKGGISVNAVFVDRPEFFEIAKRINEALPQVGGWFFQLKEAADGSLKLLEVASRIAGTSGITRATGVNLPLLTANIFNGIDVDSVIINDYDIELDRALGNSFRVDLDYTDVYVDYDDTMVVDNQVNLEMITFLYKCFNEGKRLVLLTHHDGELQPLLNKYRLTQIFDEIIHINRGIPKYKYVTGEKPVFIDDSYGERKEVAENCGCPVFDTHTIEALL